MKLMSRSRVPVVRRTSPPAQLRRLGDGRKVTVPMLSFFKRLFSVDKVGGVAVAKSPLASHRVIAMLLVPLLMMLNRRFELGLTEENITQFVAVVLLFIGAKSIEDIVVRMKVLLASAAKELPPVPTEAPIDPLK